MTYIVLLLEIIFEDPYWDAEWVEDNMVTDLPPIEVEDMLF